MNGSPSRQSYVSCELTHFLGRWKPTDDDRFALLCEILRSGRLGTAQGDMHFDFTHPLTSNKLIVPQTVCFCDIPLDSIHIHMKKYSQFGLAFSKAFMKKAWGCSPVYYVSEHAPCTDHRYGKDDSRRQVKWGTFFDDAFREWLPTLPRTNGRIDAAKLTPMQNLMIWYVFGHVKFFNSTLADDHPENWYMEREWRLIGSMTFKIADVARVILPERYVPQFHMEFPDLSVFPV